MHPVRLAPIAALLLLCTGPVGAADTDDTTARDEEVLRAAKVGTDGPALLEFFRQRVGSDATRARVRELVKQLGDDSFDVREKASEGLVALGRVALPALREALKDRDAEVTRRAGDCLRLIDTEAGTALASAALRRLAARKPAGAAAALLDYLPGADAEGTADEVRTALSSVAVRDGKADPALVKALADAAPLRRGAAAEALCRAGAKDQRDALVKLLRDKDADVRLRVAIGLLSLKEREAGPVLIDLLRDLPRSRGWEAEEVLQRLAGETAPSLTLDGDEAARAKCRDAWLAWWKKNGDKADFARVDGHDRPLGFTLVVVQVDGKEGRVLEVTAAGKVRWQIDGLQYPLDAHMIGGDRVLIAENGGSRVTERNLRGEILWEKTGVGAFAAQRLPNGNVFLATSNNRLIEVNRDGKEVTVHKLPREETILAAQKLRDGQIGYVSGDKYVRLDTGGKEVRRWSVGGVQTRGGLDLLPNGGVLVARVHEDKVVEYDRDGKSVWEASVKHPTSVVRLRNGNTLVAGWNTGLVVELDRAGRVVWEHKTSGEMSRARRR